MAYKKIKIKIPASTSNLGPGFDTLGVALNLYNQVEVIRKTNKKRIVSIACAGEGEDVLPRNKANLVYRAMEKVFRKFNVTGDEIIVKLSNNIPLSSGLGSSSAAIVGGLLASNMLCGNRLTQEDLINMAVEIEGHPDNAVPAIAGGLCVCCMSGKKVKYVKIALPKDIKFVMCIPELKISTDMARKILPKRISYSDAVFNVQRVSLLLASLINKKYDLLSTAVQDRLHQPYRKKLIPGCGEVFKTAKDMGSLGTFISGSGPSIAAICGDDIEANNKIGKALCAAYRKRNISCRYEILSCDLNGAKIL